MDLIKEFFDPVPIVAIALAIFGFVMLWVIAKALRFPEGFSTKQELREEIRFRLLEQRMSADEEGNATKENAPAEDGATAEPAPENSKQGT